VRWWVGEAAELERRALERMEARYDVLLEGTPFVDLTFSFSALSRLPCLGEEIFAHDFAMNPGSTFNVAYQMAGLGLKVGLFAQFGNDIFGRFITERMDDAGLPREFIVQRDEPLPLVSAAISTPEDRLFISYEAPRLRELQAPRITPAVLDRYRPRAIVMWGSLVPDAMQCARELNVLLVLDTYWNVEHLRSDRLRTLAGLVDVITPNLREAREMSGEDSPDACLEVLSSWCPCVVITTGAGGCVAAQGDERFRVPPIPVNVRDTTGAGEGFNAGLVYGLLRGYPLETCLKCANITGALSTQVLGGPGRRASVKDIDEWLAHYSP
jgi:sugar/nucleoside kinase (ribokinase family)